MGLMIWLFAGVLVGWLTYTFWPKSAFGSVANFAVAVLGGLLGGFLSIFLFPSVNPIYNITGQSFLTALVVALVFLVSFRMAATRIRANRRKPVDIPKAEAER